MKSAPGCIPCVLGQVLRFAREVAEDEWLHRKVLEEVMGSLPGSDWGRTPAEILTDAFATARKTLRVQDPFAKRRKDLDLRVLAAEVRERMAQVEDPFALATKAAAAANVIDGLMLGALDVALSFRALVDKGFAFGSADELRAALDPVKQVLYVLDNAGEAALDAILIEQIRGLGKEVTVSARRPGLAHDATREDAVAAGITGTIVDTGQEVLAATPVLCGQEFRAAFDAAELIVAKGSAAYETLVYEKKDVIHILHVKCEPVARALGGAVGDLVLVRS
ncbi:MAG TPA: ARMT1-like domain-containing protein [Planctomycetota bacterium]|nr:ARMT1-like domain-containing protein [Planctomycetota bacterium]